MPAVAAGSFDLDRESSIEGSTVPESGQRIMSCKRRQTVEPFLNRGRDQFVEKQIERDRS